MKANITDRQAALAETALKTQVEPLIDFEVEPKETNYEEQMVIDEELVIKKWVHTQG